MLRESCQTSRQNAKKEVRFPGIYRYLFRVLENVDILLRFPYGEPHLAVRYGIAVFEYVRILTISWLAKHALDS